MMRPSVRLLVLAAAAAALATLPACGDHVLFAGDPNTQVPSDGEWQETEPLDVPSVEVLWNHTVSVLENLDLPPDEGRTDYARREIVTRWITRLAPIRYDGKRYRAHVRLVPASGGRWIAQVAVVRQSNTDMNDPTSAAHARWERDGVEFARAARILWQIRAGFDPELRGAPAETQPDTRR